MTKEALVPEVVEKSIEKVLRADIQRPIDQMLDGNEAGYQKCLDLAMRATTSRDWIDMGGKPYLCESGAKKTAFRFGLSILFDRDPNGRVIFDREETEDEFGKIFIYTITGRAKLAVKEIEAIGTASTRDQFFGWFYEQDPNYPDDPKKKIRKPKPIYDVVEDAKKKAITNFTNNSIKSFLGLGGQSWEDLAKYGIYPEGKQKVDYKTNKPGATATKQTQNQTDSRPPFWEWDGKDGGKMISAKPGTHFSDAFLAGVGMRANANKSIYTCKWGETQLNALKKEFENAGKQESPEPGSEG